MSHDISLCNLIVTQNESYSSVSWLKTPDAVPKELENVPTLPLLKPDLNTDTRQSSGGIKFNE